MTTVAYTLGTPRIAAERGGDCHARDLDQGRNVHGPHRFAATTDCRINNGLLRLTVGASGAAPTLTVEAWRGRVVIGDTYSDTYSDTYGGEYSTPAWFAMGTLTIDSPSVSALLTAVRIVRINPEALTIRLVAPLMADAFVTLKRGERHCHIQHGSTRSPLVTTTRRVHWTAAPSPVGTARTGRVEEVTPEIAGFPRYVGAIDPVTVDAGAFSLTTTAVTRARFGAGVATYATKDKTADLHRQLGNASRPRLVVA
jgi:hypothetical protein